MPRLAPLALVVSALSGPLAAQCDLDAVPGTLDPLGAGSAQYGHALDADGGRLVVSSAHEQVLSFGDAPFQGAAWVHRLEGGAWVEEAKLEGVGFVNGDGFGWDCAIDGDTLLVGAPGPCSQDCFPGLPPGQAVFYERGPGGWTEVLRTTSSEALESDAFGRSVDVSGDVAVVGAIAAGRAYVFERLGGVWTEVATLTGDVQKAFGWDVAVDGQRVVVSAPLAQDVASAGAGAVHVFEPVGGVWTEVATVPAPPDPGELVWFGRAVALSGDRLAVGAPRSSYVGAGSTLFSVEPGVVSSGAVLVFERQPDGTWPLAARVGEVEPGPSKELGASVALDGDLLLAGASRDGARGEAHLFEHTPLGWAQRAALEIPDPDPDAPFGPQPDERFGHAVALGGGLLAAGAPGKDGADPDDGAVYAAPLDALACATPRLLGAPTFLHAPLGGSHVLALDAGPAHAGAVYLVAGSLSGTAPGTPVGAVVVPLNLDAYALASVTGAGTGAFVQTVGVLDADGRADAALAVPPGLAVGASGLEAHHAAVVLGAAGAELAAGPARLRLLP